MRTLILALGTLVVSLVLGALPAWAEPKDERGCTSSDYAATSTRVEGLKSLAERGNVDAQFELGFMYGTGFCGPQDYAKAVYWYSQAAEKMHVVSQSILGWMYEEGHGVAQDYVQAHMWYNIASAQGHEPASKYRDRLSKKMPASQIAEAQKMAREWRPRK